MGDKGEKITNKAMTRMTKSSGFQEAWSGKMGRNTESK